MQFREVNCKQVFKLMVKPFGADLTWIRLQGNILALCLETMQMCSLPETKEVEIVGELMVANTVRERWATFYCPSCRENYHVKMTEAAYFKVLQEFSDVALPEKECKGCEEFGNSFDNPGS